MGPTLVNSSRNNTGKLGNCRECEDARWARLPAFAKPVGISSGLGRYQTGPNSKFKFKFKKIKIHKPVIPAGKPVIPAGKLVKPVGIPAGTGCTCDFEFGFKFNRFLSVSGQTDLINHYRRAAV